MLDGERKSIQPMAERLEGGNFQALQQFVRDSPWSSETVQTELFQRMDQRFIKEKKADIILDDTALSKKGKASVGVDRQYCGALGKIDNCQSLVSWQCSVGNIHFPMAARLYLPECWTEDTKRMERAGVPEKHQKFKEKWKISLELLDQSSVSVDTLIFDAGYGSNRKFLKELDERNYSFVGQIRGIETF